MCHGGKIAMSIVISECKICKSLDRVKSTTDRYFYTKDNRRWKGAVCPDCIGFYRKHPTKEQLAQSIKQHTENLKKKDYLKLHQRADYPWVTARVNLIERLTDRHPIKYTAIKIKQHFQPLLTSKGLTWQDYGRTWCIDHIVPIWAYRDAFNIKNPGYWHRLPNLQPLTFAEHHDKTLKETDIKKEFDRTGNVDWLKTQFIYI